MSLSTIPVLFINLFVVPPLFLTVSFTTGIITATSLLFHLTLPSSFKAFRSLWFARLWLAVGPISTKKDLRHIRPIAGQAYGVVIDLGPGSGLTVAHFDKTKITKIYGIEPCLELHSELRKNIKAAGLSDIYTILPCGAQDTAALHKAGVLLESVDTVITVKVLCSVPAPVEPITRGLYELLVPGGKWLVFEHIQNRDCWVTRVLQSVYQLAWPHLLSGCNINRPTDKMFAAIGEWELVDLEKPKGEHSWEIFPHVMGKLVKATR